ncbi:hypothetical protein ACIGT4_00315 [Streptomyces sioyaensis]|uniref:hypothetical protein n=1 Tax=Streptomyces sioyaensis TaxID=67364 RepID=UPI0037D17E9F
MLHAQSPAFAPFSAVLIMQMTVYRSLLDSSRYVAAVVAGVAVLPPLRYRGAEHGIRTLAHALCDLVSDVYPALRAHDVDPERTER